jgi:hypothetical protein
MKNQKEIHKMRRIYLIILRYLASCPSHLLLGGVFLVVPPFFSILLMALWKNQDFLWTPPFFGMIGYFLLIPSAFGAACPAEKRMARHTLLVGFAVMLSLCCLILSLRLSQENSEISNSKDEILQRSLGAQSPKVPHQVFSSRHPQAKERTYDLMA